MLDITKISRLGFGCMRFKGAAENAIDIEAVSQMIDTYLESGGNYFDTAWAYSNSEAALNKALVQRHPRDSFMIATKCIAWTECTSREELEAQLQQSLERLGIDYIDVYLMHNLGNKRTDMYRKYDAWNFVKAAKERGLVKHIGFSAHCTPTELDEYLGEFPEAEIVQLQVNYLDWENPSFRERECVEVANRHGVPIIAMEPVKGGILADPPAAVRPILDKAFPGLSYATAALEFTASVEGVICTLSGMNTLEMVEENCRAFSDFTTLNDAQREAIKQAQKALASSETIPCTGCNYCAKVCPQNIGISGALSALNYFINFKDPEKAAHQMEVLISFNEGKNFPSDCISCGACESVCPQNIPILECFERIEKEITPYSKGPGGLTKQWLIARERASL